MTRFVRAMAILAAVILAILPTIAQDKITRNGSLPNASPDGKQVVFVSDRSGKRLLYIMNIDGSGVHDLGPASTGSRAPIWTADGEWIIFAKDAEHAMAMELAAIRPNGKDRRTIASLDSVGWPRVSPDGKRVALGAISGQPQHIKGQILIVDVDGGGQRTMPTADLQAWDPVWSPDGRQIVFSQLPDVTEPTKTTTKVFIADVSGDNRRTLATYPGFIQLPNWSLDGRTIAYMTFNGPAKSADIVLLDVASGTFKQITRHDKVYQDETPAWLPDGRLLFQSNRDGRYEIYLMRPDGSGQTRLTH